MAEKRNPDPPARLWGLWNESGADDGLGCWLQHELAGGLRCGPIVFASEGEATRAAGAEVAELRRVFGDSCVIRAVLIGVAPVRGAGPLLGAGPMRDLDELSRRLRAWGERWPHEGATAALMAEAAGELERLRAELESLRVAKANEIGSYLGRLLTFHVARGQGLEAEVGRLRAAIGDYRRGRSGED